MIFAGHQASSLSDDRTVGSWSGPRDLQPDREGASLQTEDRDGVAGGGQHHLPGYLSSKGSYLIRAPGNTGLLRQEEILSRGDLGRSHEERDEGETEIYTGAFISIS